LFLRNKRVTDINLFLVSGKREREKAASSGAAMPDGSSPIENEEDLINAMRFVGHAKDLAKAKAQIPVRAVVVPETQSIIGTQGLTKRFGAIPHDAGTLSLEGTELPPCGTIAERMTRGIVLVPGDRTREGLFDGMTVVENLLLNSTVLGASPWSASFTRGEVKLVRGISRKFDIRPRNERALIDWLSGGNQQKVVLARWLMAEARLMILEEPTAGVNIGAKPTIYGMLRDAAGAGARGPFDWHQRGSTCRRHLHDLGSALRYIGRYSRKQPADGYAVCRCRVSAAGFRGCAAWCRVNSAGSS